MTNIWISGPRGQQLPAAVHSEQPIDLTRPVWAVNRTVVKYVLTVNSFLIFVLLSTIKRSFLSLNRLVRGHRGGDT